MAFGDHIQALMELENAESAPRPQGQHPISHSLEDLLLPEQNSPSMDRRSSLHTQDKPHHQQQQHQQQQQQALMHQQHSQQHQHFHQQQMYQWQGSAAVPMHHMHDEPAMHNSKPLHLQQAQQQHQQYFLHHRASGTGSGVVGDHMHGFQSMPQEGFAASGSGASHFRGVSRKSNGQWEAGVFKNGGWAYRQSFASEVEAALGYDAAIRRLEPHDAAAYVNFAPQQLHPVATQPMSNSQLEPTSWDVSGLFDANSGAQGDEQSGASSGAQSDMRGRQMHSSGQLSGMHEQTGVSGRGMFKSSSVSTLLAATTLSDIGPHGVAIGESPHLGSWQPVPVSAGFEHSPIHPQDMSAASLLLAADGGSGGLALHEQLASMAPRARGVDSSGGQPTKKGSLGSGGLEGRPPRRVASAQDLSSASSRDKTGGGGIAKAVSKPGATRVSNRRANSRYAKDKVKAEGCERAAAVAGSSGRGTRDASRGKPSGTPKSEEEIAEERVQVYRALMLGQERLHEQMRAHQAQHEEQQKRAAQREVERAAAAASAPLASSPHGSMGMHALPIGTSTSMGNMHTGGVPTSMGGSAIGGLRRDEAGYGGRPGSAGGRGRGGIPFVPTSSPGDMSGGKMPRRIPSEPHSLAQLGVAGMGGRHRPATTRGSNPTGIRKVRSSHNFGQYQSQALHSASNTMKMPSPSHGPSLRASPSMPAFPVMERDNSRASPALPNIHEDREEREMPRLPEPMSTMFLDDPDAGDEELLNLMSDLADPGSTGFDLDLPLPGDPGHGDCSGRRQVSGTGGGELGSVEVGGRAEAPPNRTSSDLMPSDLSPSFLNLDGGLPPLDEDDINSVFLDA